MIRDTLLSSHRIVMRGVIEVGRISNNTPECLKNLMTNPAWSRLARSDCLSSDHRQRNT